MDDFSERGEGTDEYTASLRQRAGMNDYVKARGIWRVRHFDKEGTLLDVDVFENIVVNVGLDDLLDVTLNGAAQTTTWYLGLIAEGTPTLDATDTMSSHAGWTENTNYDEASRPTWSNGAVSGQSVDNSGSPASYTMNTDGDTVGGAFLVGDNTKGGTTGPLYAEGAFSTTKNPDSGDTLEVTATFTTSSA